MDDGDDVQDGPGDALGALTLLSSQSIDVLDHKDHVHDCCREHDGGQDDGHDRQPQITTGDPESYVDDPDHDESQSVPLDVRASEVSCAVASDTLESYHVMMDICGIDDARYDGRDTDPID